MNKQTATWPKVSKDRPCPKCGKTERCTLTSDGRRGRCWREGRTWCDERSGEDEPKPVKPRPAADTKKAKTVYPTLEAAIVAKMSARSTRGGGWTYRDSAGERELMHVERFDLPDGDKCCLPFSPLPDGTGWYAGDPPAPLPLYGLDVLAETGAVYVVEGEKCANAARSIELCTVTSSHGAQQARRTDWTPLAGRDLVVLIDRDDPGEQYGRDVAEIVQALNPPARVKIVRLEHPTPGADTPKGFDVADWLDKQGGSDSGELRQAIEKLANGVDWCHTFPVRNTDASPLSLPAAFRPFPVHLLPEAAAAIVQAGATSIGCDPSYLALPALAALAGVIGNTRHVVVKEGWTEPAIIWAMLIGASGTAKTPAAKIVLRPLHERHGRLISANEEALRQYSDEIKRYKVDLQTWERNRGEGDAPAEPELPTLERAIIEDTTIEALVPVLRDNPRGVLLHRDEMAGWIGGFDRYAQHGGGDLARWLSISNGEAITVDRRMTGTTYVSRPAVSIIGGIQPDRLPQVLTRTMRDSGLLARILMTHPPAMPKRFNLNGLDASAVDAWQRQLAILWTLGMNADAHGQPVPCYVSMSEQARRRFGVWADAFNAETVELPGELASARSKLEAYAVRFALIFAVCELSPRVEVAHVERGCALADWFAAEAERIYARLQQGDADREATEMRDWIVRRGGRVTVRGVACTGPRRYRGRTDAAKAALNRLVAAGHAEWNYAPAGPGRPSLGVVLIDPTARDYSVGDGIKNQQHENLGRGFDSAADASASSDAA